MTSDSTHRHHTFDYIELKATDMAAAKAFYAKAFGFQFTEYAPGYLGIQGEGREQGGITLADEVHRGGPLVVLYSSNLEATYEAVKAAGGTISVETFTFPGGRRFQFLDPSGNELAVWSER